MEPADKFHTSFICSNVSYSHEILALALDEILQATFHKRIKAFCRITRMQRTLRTPSMHQHHILVNLAHLNSYKAALQCNSFASCSLPSY